MPESGAASFFLSFAYAHSRKKHGVTAIHILFCYSRNHDLVNAEVLAVSSKQTFLRLKKYSKDKIQLMIRSLVTHRGDAEKQREVLINAFVKKVTFDTGGYIKVELYLFGYDIKSKSGDSESVSVRIKSALPRQFECITDLYVHHYGFGVKAKSDEVQKWLCQQKTS